MSKSKTDQKEKETVEAPKLKLPKGVSQEMYDETKAIILSGFKAEQDPNAIKSEIFKGGVPFGKLTTLYNMITKSEGLVVDPKIVTAAVTKALDKITLKGDEDYAALATIATDISKNIKGATVAKVITKIKTWYKENEMEFPRKPAPTRGRMGAINKTLINVFKENKKASEADCKKALIDVTKTPKNAEYYAKQYHKMLYAVANGLSANEVLTVFSADDDTEEK